MTSGMATKTISNKNGKNKKMQKALGLLMLTGVLFFAMLGSAFAETKTEKLTIRENDVYYGDKGDLTALKMTSSTSTKELWIEGEALKAASKKNKTFGIKMDDYTLKFAPDVFYTDAWNDAAKAGDPMEIKLVVDCDALLDMSTHFDSMVQNKLNNYNFTSYGLKIEADIYVAGKRKHTYTQFAKPITVAYDYSSAWNRNPSDLKEKALTLGWYDLEKTLSASRKWTRMPSKVNTTNKTLTSQLTYACGFYLPILVKGADNTGSGSSDSTQTGNDSGDVTAPIGGVPTGHWAETDIMAMQQAGIIPGDLNSVNVETPIARGEFVAYLTKILKLEENLSLAGTFTDITESNPYYKQILTAAYHKIVNGNTSTSFAPNAKINRAEMAVMLHRALTFKGISSSTDPAKLNAMSDAAKCPSWAKNGASAVVNLGLMGAKNGNKFEFSANTTWAEAVVILNRLYGIVSKA